MHYVRILDMIRAQQRRIYPANDAISIPSRPSKAKRLLRPLLAQLAAFLISYVPLIILGFIIKFSPVSTDLPLAYNSTLTVNCLGHAINAAVYCSLAREMRKLYNRYLPRCWRFQNLSTTATNTQNGLFLVARPPHTYPRVAPKPSTSASKSDPPDGAKIKIKAISAAH